MITIYHNSRCRKSREAHQLLVDSGLEFTVRFYLDDPLSKTQLKALVKKIGVPPLDLVRTSEVIWKEQYKGKTLSEAKIYEAMAAHPKLIERPILASAGDAVIGRPIDNIYTFIENYKQYLTKH